MIPYQSAVPKPQLNSVVTAAQGDSSGLHKVKTIEI